jgi:pilus assembly protein Flp/PilA
MPKGQPTVNPHLFAKAGTFATGRPGSFCWCRVFNLSLGEAKPAHHKAFGEKPMLQKWQARVKDFLRREEGATAVEYAILLALIIINVFNAVTVIGSKTNATFNTVGSKLGSSGS